MITISGAIFDVDGTLLDSTNIWEGLGENYLGYLGGTPNLQRKKALGPTGIGAAARYFKDMYGSRKSLEELESDIYAMLEDFYFNHAELKPHAAQFVNTLHEKGARMCIGTATPSALVDGALRRCGIRECFERIFSSYDMHTSKSNPAFFEAAGEYLGTPRENTWVFDDALYAVETAKEAGFHAAAPFDPRERDPAGVRACADLYFRDFSEFPPYVVPARKN